MTDTRQRGLRSRMAGLSLIELMISITLGLMILSGVAIVFTNSSAARNEVERTSRQIENGRYAIEVLSDDLRLAGFYGELNVASVDLPGGMPGDPCSLTATDWPLWIRLHVQGFADATSLATCALENWKENTDILLVRRVSTCVAGSAGCDPAINPRAYIQVSLCGTEVTTHRLGAFGAVAFDLTKKDCTSPADLRQYFVHIYYISKDNGAGVSVPTLKRIELDGNVWKTPHTPLVEGIEQLKIEYGIDNVIVDGAPDSYVATPASLAEWTSVVAVNVHLLASNLEASPDYTDNKTYTLGSTTFTPGGNFRRHVYSSLVRLNNPSGRQDRP